MPMDRDERHQFFGVLSVVAAFVLGLLGTFVVNQAIYGSGEFDGNAGASFAVLVEGTTIGCLLAIITLFVALHLYWSSRRRNR
jgi:cytochrome c biogenesis factor